MGHENGSCVAVVFRIYLTRRVSAIDGRDALC